MLTLKMDIDTEIYHNASVDAKYVLIPNQTYSFKRNMDNSNLPQIPLTRQKVLNPSGVFKLYQRQSLIVRSNLKNSVPYFTQSRNPIPACHQAVYFPAWVRHK